jgi:hypothetical protein
MNKSLKPQPQQQQQQHHQYQYDDSVGAVGWDLGECVLAHLVKDFGGDLRRAVERLGVVGLCGAQEAVEEKAEEVEEVEEVGEEEVVAEKGENVVPALPTPHAAWLKPFQVLSTGEQVSGC